MMRKTFQEVKGQNSKIRKNDKKRHFRRSKVKVLKIRKNDEKRLSGGQRSNIKKSKK
jgi:ethanolamine utilization protein EutQ (cupin superfamily)